ncbi:DUF6537 domain-containing protein [Streptomyces sp. NPDC002328]|uniref:DUF6537 domain-containing protein n=1 Tax=Streptomyces sp. NPDC002328 TaxID=3364642 RepID=UPI0036A3B3A5
MSVLVDDSAEAVSAAYVQAGDVSGVERFGDGAQGCRLVQLVVQYRREVEEVLHRHSPLTLAFAAKLASLPDMVRAYEQIKVQNVHRYREELTRLPDEFRGSHRLDPLDRTSSGSTDRWTKGLVPPVSGDGMAHQVVAAERTTDHVSPSRA